MCDGDKCEVEKFCVGKFTKYPLLDNSHLLKPVFAAFVKSLSNKNVKRAGVYRNKMFHYSVWLAG